VLEREFITPYAPMNILALCEYFGRDYKNVRQKIFLIKLMISWLSN